MIPFGSVTALPQIGQHCSATNVDFRSWADNRCNMDLRLVAWARLPSTYPWVHRFGSFMPTNMMTGSFKPSLLERELSSGSTNCGRVLGRSLLTNPTNGSLSRLHGWGLSSSPASCSWLFSDQKSPHDPFKCRP